MTKNVSRVLATMAVSSALAFPGVALADVDYSFLDGLTLDELIALQDEVGSRIEASQNTENADDADDFGVWDIRYFVDEFDRPTDDGYVITLTNNGHFSNSATSRSDLMAQIMFQPLASDWWYLQIFLYEYNRSQVLGSWKTITYDVTVLDGNGEKHYYTATLPEDGDRVNFSFSDTAEIMELISDGGSVSFKLKDHDDAQDSYLLTIDDCSGFDNACNKLLADSGFSVDEGLSDEEIPADAKADDTAVSGDAEETAVSDAVYTDGTYEATDKGIGGDVPVTVTVKDGKVASVEVGENSETQGIGSKAIEQLPAEIVAANGTEGVDAVSGASVTSKAIFTAVDDCLKQAKGGAAASDDKAASKDAKSDKDAKADASASYKDGEYTASSKGIGGDVPVTVTIKGGKIASVEVGDNSETTGIGSKAIEQLPDEIVKANGTDGVDAISGASVTSKAIFTAVSDCLNQAISDTASVDVKSSAGKVAADSYKDGVYTAEGKGIGGEVPVTVTIKDGKVAKVEVGDNSETQGIGSRAIEQLPDEIVAANGTEDVDAVSGASVTSKAIFTAVNDCLNQAKA